VYKYSFFRQDSTKKCQERNEKYTLLKKCITVLIAALLVASFFVENALAESAPDIYVDGEIIDDGGMSYIENGTTFVPLRAVSVALGADSVKWEKGYAHVTAPGLELTAEAGQNYFTANGRYLYVKAAISIQNGRMMLPARLLCRAFGASIKWNRADKEIYITTGETSIESGDSFYDENDLYWLSRIIQAEASGESLEGKIAVGNVVLNRVQSPFFPDSVYDVIFDKRYGIQFTPAYSGAIKRAPSDESEAAAKLALEGTDIAGASLYFVASSVAASSWMGKNRQYFTQIGNHCFYT